MSLLRKIYRKIRPDQRPFILAYHRVKDVPIDPWEMAVSPANFELQMKALCGRTGGPLKRALLREPGPRAFVTFDDGYADNYNFALPILKKYNIPATIFLATGYLGCGREYWWDRLERIFLLPGRLPEILDIHVMGDDYRFPLKQDASYSDEDFNRHRSWLPFQSPPTMRQMIYAILWSILHRAERPYQDAMIARLEDWSGYGPEPRKDFSPMTIEQVREMSDEGIHFGAHTVNHVAIHHTPKEALPQEAEESKRRVTEITGRETTLFSYPYGQTNPTMQNILTGLNIDVACTSQNNRISRETPPLEVPRISANNKSLRLIHSLLG